MAHIDLLPTGLRNLHGVRLLARSVRHQRISPGNSPPQSRGHLLHQDQCTANFDGMRDCE